MYHYSLVGHSALFSSLQSSSINFSVVSFVCRGTDVSIENMHQGFTHVFESTFESTEGVKEYIEHPAHVDYANELLPLMEKVLVIDYKPAAGKA
jgi:hypothetical protein